MKLCRSYSVHNENLLVRKFSSPCSWQTISKFLQKNNMRLIALIFYYILDNFYSKLQVYLHMKNKYIVKKVENTPAVTQPQILVFSLKSRVEGRIVLKI